MKTLLHVGCGPLSALGKHGFDRAIWREIRQDIDPGVHPDLGGSMTNLSALSDESVDAVYSSHNLEHLYPHEAPKALREFFRVLKPDGFLIATCPDIQSVCALVAKGHLLEPVYFTPAHHDPISPLDILYGWRKALCNGHYYMAHKNGFTQQSLVELLKDCGFVKVAAQRREKAFALYTLSSKCERSPEAMLELARRHFS